MKTIIAGSRGIDSYYVVDFAIHDSGFNITEIVSGCARGVDQTAEKWAWYNDIPVKKFPADWDKHGKAAGPMRNREMAAYADALVAIWDGESRGTKNMIHEARKAGLDVYILTRLFVWATSQKKKNILVK